jgi:hypothetical protein
MSDALPFALLALVVAFVAAMPWQRPHPNHDFMLKLLSSYLCDETDQPTFGGGDP